MSRYTNLCEDTTRRVAAMLDTAEVKDGNFERPWDKIQRQPLNASTDKAYRGCNVLLLSLTEDNHARPYWATYRQWLTLDRQVRRGEHGTHIYKWLRIGEGDDPEPGQSTTRSGRLVPKVYTTFHYDQTEPGLEPGQEPWSLPPAPPPRNAGDRIVELDEWVQALGVKLEHGAEQASYVPDWDFIQMPFFADFDSADAYYSVLLHELVHWSGAAKRLGRECASRYHESDEWRAKEELVAELGAAMGCAAWGVTNSPRASHAVYLNTWLKVFANDTKYLFTASTAAQRSLSYLDGLATIDPAAAASVSPGHGLESAL